METRSMISFDWALKRLLRSKAHFEVLEGFLSELLHRKIIIKHIGESEGNKEHETDKFNKVDILVEADERELVIIELQYDSEDDYFQRMLYGVSKAITEYISESDEYLNIRKVYSINIVYFELGTGDDYIYHGITKFIGLHTQNELQLTEKQKQLYGKTVPGELNPEYYIIKVRKFNDIAKNTLDEWIYYLKNNKIRDDFTAQGLDKARQILALDKLSDAEKKQYDRHIKENRIRNSEVVTAYTDGEIKGRAEGKAERDQLKAERDQLETERDHLKKEQETVIRNMHREGMPVENISAITGLSPEKIREILK
jgi:predicted transposase/invertase (TIGR01784 family)